MKTPLQTELILKQIKLNTDIRFIKQNYGSATLNNEFDLDKMLSEKEDELLEIENQLEVLNDVLAKAEEKN